MLKSASVFRRKAINGACLRISRPSDLFLNPRVTAAAIIAVIAIASIGIWFYVSSLSQPVDEVSLRIYADPMTENVLHSLEVGNYTSFLRDMDQKMRDAFTESSFAGLHDLLLSKVGHYEAKTYSQAGRSGEFITVYYKALYSMEQVGVSVKVVFTTDSGGSTLISGLWLNSPKLAS